LYPTSNLSLPGLVDHHQTTFIKGRQLMQTFVSTQELLHHLAKNKIPSLFMKVNFQKEFDILSWNFLLKVLKTLDFPNI
jgi:hypothetical protein